MKYLILNGSARNNSTTEATVNKVKEVLEDNNVQYDVVITGNITGCSGCTKCYTSNHCVIPDHLSQIMENIETYDCILVVSAIYAFSFSSKLKAMIERLSPQLARINSMALITLSGSCGEDGGEDLSIEQFRRMCKYGNTKYLGALPIITGDKEFSKLGERVPNNIRLFIQNLIRQNCTEVI